MLFNSTEFVVFLAIVLLAFYGGLGGQRAPARRALLLFASYAFYMSWNPFFGILLALSTGVDYTVARRLEDTERPGRRRALLAASLFTNLGLLGFYKYGHFVAGNLMQAGLLASDSPLRPWVDVALPVGISFYTFQTLSYTLEVYWRRQRAHRSWVEFALYVSFFPQLVAGPIVRPQELLPQLGELRGASGHDVEVGLMRLFMGLFKKVVVADTLGALVDRCFAAPDTIAGPVLLLGLYAYAYQIYFDFSGYSDMAIGLARLFGITLPENFDRPYTATSPREFWQRWHITLSTWLRDYLYIPLGGNRRGAARTYGNLLITMVLGGLWHGAGWNFIAWGAYHGLWLMGHRWLSARRAPRLPRAARQLGTFHGVLLGWMVFRSPSLPAAVDYGRALLDPGGLTPPTVAVALAFVVGASLVQGLGTRDGLRDAILRLPGWAQGAGYGLVAVLVYLYSDGGQRFIYFQF